MLSATAPASARRLPVICARALALVALAAAAVPVAAWLWVAAHQLTYPFELDWMEGGAVELVARVLAGHSLYVAPTLRYVGWTYPPLYWWLCAALAELTGIGFLPLRVISAAATGATLVLLWRIVRAESGDGIAGALAAGLYAASFPLSGWWFDVGREDSLFLALTLLALAIGREARGARGGALFGAVAFLACFTKQTALVAVAPGLVLLILRLPRAGAAAAIALGGLLGASTLILDGSSGGWYRYYVLDELSGQPLIAPLWLGFWRQDMLAEQWPAMLAGCAGLVAGAVGGVRGRALRQRAIAWWCAGAAGLIAGAWISRVHSGGFANVLMPAYAAVALMAGLGVAAARRRGAFTGAIAVGLEAAQIALLVRPLGGQIPSAVDLSRGAALLAALRALPRPVLVLRHPWYATEVGAGSFAQEEAIGDVLRSSAPRGRRALERSLRGGLARYRIRAVVLDGTFDEGLLAAALQRDFRLRSSPITPAPLYPLTDTQTAPRLVWVRR